MTVIKKEHRHYSYNLKVTNPLHYLSKSKKKKF